MSFEEKSTWIYALILVGVSVVYYPTVFGQLSTTSAAAISYQATMLTAIGVAIAVAIVAHIVVAIAWPKDADKSDERDTNINRFGEYIGSFVLYGGGLVALGLALAEFEYFWIANAIFTAFVLSGFTTTVVKLVGYRRGF